ncbi:hypothetical protein [Natrinema gelatinilyticum]|uniref:hypothetical protein n=1 Tax=Natrinema gelatinilyticum TaxID=2961571 RepID=UPI0020C4CC35|nr:hypothetical protein [Natrinema gelatinilyticum]
MQPARTFGRGVLTGFLAIDGLEESFQATVREAMMGRSDQRLYRVAGSRRDAGRGRTDRDSVARLTDDETETVPPVSEWID